MRLSADSNGLPGSDLNNQEAPNASELKNVLADVAQLKKQVKDQGRVLLAQQKIIQDQLSALATLQKSYQHLAIRAMYNDHDLIKRCVDLIEATYKLRKYHNSIPYRVSPTFNRICRPVTESYVLSFSPNTKKFDSKLVRSNQENAVVELDKGLLLIIDTLNNKVADSWKLYPKYRFTRKSHIVTIKLAFMLSIFNIFKQHEVPTETVRNNMILIFEKMFPGDALIKELVEGYRLSNVWTNCIDLSAILGMFFYAVDLNDAGKDNGLRYVLACVLSLCNGYRGDTVLYTQLIPTSKASWFDRIFIFALDDYIDQKKLKLPKSGVLKHFDHGKSIDMLVTDYLHWKNKKSNGYVYSLFEYVRKDNQSLLYLARSSTSVRPGAVRKVAKKNRGKANLKDITSLANKRKRSSDVGVSTTQVNHSIVDNNQKKQKAMKLEVGSFALTM